ncbi:hypothetical protein BB559_000505 [Furculomyces boomerangus]|uniref:HAT C-terminal dimerisation domain-containing protein n=2 Tax=Harpellales TaxID=61421 RepID=A0A2T9Z4Z3_9FUNG|nr:hypothetical protein BB559_000505 [Furculomyces boomerangus]PVZ97680.1 hypothetical protein BB558_006361 [Smittium angustum]
MVSSVINVKRDLSELLQRIRDRHNGYADFIIGPEDNLAKEIDERLSVPDIKKELILEWGNKYSQAYITKNLDIQNNEPFSSEVDRRFVHPSLPLENNSPNSAMYPRISIMSRDFLGISSTLVPSESAFSKAGLIVDKRRARLGDNAIQATCKLQSFLLKAQGQTKVL